MMCTEFQLPPCPIAVTRKLLQYLNYHSTVPPFSIPTPLPNDSLEDVVDTFDIALIDCDNEVLMHLLLVR